MQQFRIEKCGWSYQDWAGVFHPVETALGEFLTYCADSALEVAMGMLVAFRYEDGEDDKEHYPIIPRVGKAMDAEARQPAA
jgi:hypothetical protein